MIFVALNARAVVEMLENACDLGVANGVQEFHDCKRTLIEAHVAYKDMEQD